MITGWLEVRLIMAVAGLAVAIHLARWRRRSRAEWNAYDLAHDDDPPLRHTGAALRARRAKSE